MSDRSKDLELVKKTLAGEREAFGMLFEMYSKPIFRFVFYKVGKKEIAEDITSQTFEKALKGLEGFDQASTFKTWLFTIARNTVIDHYRTSSRKTNVSLSDLDDMLPSEEDISEAAQMQEEAKNLLFSLSKLKPEWRRIIEYKYLFELDNDEICYMTGRSKGNVRVILSRAIKKLKSLTKKNE